MKGTMRILFAGTPEPAVASLNALVEAGHNVVGVLTRTDAKVGRKQVLTPSPVASRATELDLPVIKVDSFQHDAGQQAISQIQELSPDIGAVVAYGGILPQHVLDLLPNGWLNLHFSLLPAYRGAAPVQWAIINQETETGAAVFQLEAGLDTGPVFATLKRALSPGETAGQVLEDLAAQGAALLSATLSDIAAGTAVATPQQGEMSWAPKITSQQVKVDPAQPRGVVLGLINGSYPAPGAWGLLETGDSAPVRLKFGPALPVHEQPQHELEPGEFLQASNSVFLVCQDGVIELVEVQPAGKKMMRAADWARGVGESTRLQTSLTHPHEFSAH